MRRRIMHSHERSCAISEMSKVETWRPCTSPKFCSPNTKKTQAPRLQPMVASGITYSTITILIIITIFSMIISITTYYTVIDNTII